MTEVNEKEFKIAVPSLYFFYWLFNRSKSLFLGPFTFTIGDTRNFGVYEGGGTVTEVKKPEIVHFVRMLFFYYYSND
jgi:hypothetical protein